MVSRVLCLLLLALGASATGCNSQVQKYVKSSVPEHAPHPTDETAPMSLKVTPGKMNGSAAGIAVEGTVTATNQTYALGSDRAVTLTISRRRVSPQ